MEVTKIKNINVDIVIGAVLEEFKSLSLVKEYPTMIKRLAEIENNKNEVVFSGELSQLHKEKESVESVLHLIGSVEGFKKAHSEGYDTYNEYKKSFRKRIESILQEKRFIKIELERTSKSENLVELDSESIIRYESFEINYETIEQRLNGIKEEAFAKCSYVDNRFQKSGVNREEFYTNHIYSIAKKIESNYSELFEYVRTGDSIPHLEFESSNLRTLLIEISVLKKIIEDKGIVIDKKEEKETLKYKWSAPIKWKADKTALGTIFGVLFEEGIISATTPANINQFIRENFIDAKGIQFRKGTLRDNISLRVREPKDQFSDRVYLHHKNTKESLKELINELKSSK